MQRSAIVMRCHLSVICNTRVLWPNDFMDQDATWYAGRHRPWPHCVRWGPSSPSPILGPYLLRPNGCMDQDVTWFGARPRPRRLCVRWGPHFPLPPWCCLQVKLCDPRLSILSVVATIKALYKYTSFLFSPKGGLNFRPMFIVVKRLDG